MKDRLSKLLSIKSIVTILFVVITLLLCAYRVIRYGESVPEQVWTILVTIIAFYFGTVSEKNQSLQPIDNSERQQAPRAPDEEGE